MRFPILGLALLAAGCAAQTASIPPAAAPAASAAPTLVDTRAARALTLLNAAGTGEAPTADQITRALGAPAIARQDGAGAALTYRLDSCALLLLFRADEAGALHLAEAHASARRAGEAAPSLAQCAAEATSD